LYLSSLVRQGSWYATVDVTSSLASFLPLKEVLKGGGAFAEAGDTLTPTLSCGEIVLEEDAR